MGEHDPNTVSAYLALGSNLGNRKAFLRGGRDVLLEHAAISLIKSSGIYETTAVGGPEDSPPFLNAVLEIATDLSPRQLLEACQAVEEEFGRTRTGHWQPRTLDIDILFYADQVVDETDLTIPHPRLYERAFVLTPLCEIAPGLLCPQRLQTVAELVTAVPECARLEALRENW